MLAGTFRICPRFVYRLALAMPHNPRIAAFAEPAYIAGRRGVVRPASNEFAAIAQIRWTKCCHQVSVSADRRNSGFVYGARFRHSGRNSRWQRCAGGIALGSSGNHVHSTVCSRKSSESRDNVMNIYFQRTNQRAFGTFPLKGKELAQALRTAVDIGYRAIDTAQMYENEADIGKVLSSLSVRRDDLCITTKVHPGNFSKDKFIPSVQESLSKLRIDCADVLLLHWPPADGEVRPSLELLAEARRQGLARNIGISNYTSKMMRQAAETVDAPIVTNQVEFHPLLNQDILLAAASETGIPLSSYCSVARGAVFKHQEFAEIGNQYGKTAAQVVLRWILQKGVSINTMSTKEENIRANFDVMDFTLSSIDMAKIDAKTELRHRIVDKNLVPTAPDWD